MVYVSPELVFDYIKLCFQFLLPYAEKERYDSEERPEVQRQILAEFAKKLPVYTRTGSGGQYTLRGVD